MPLSQVAISMTISMTSPITFCQRYARVLRIFWSAAIAVEMEYRVNFLFAALSSLGKLGSSLFALFLFYRGGYNFAGWEWNEALVVLGIFTFLQGFSAMLLVPNLNRIVTHVQEGTLDFVLLKPISSQFSLSTRSLSLWGFPDFFFGFSILFYAAGNLHMRWSDFLLSLLPLSCGAIVLYSLWFMLGATSVWFVKIYNVTEVLRGLLDAGRFPKSAYPEAFRFFFSFIVPVAFITTVPAETMLGRGQSNWLIASVVLAVFVLWFSNRFWRFALRFYTSASS